MLDPAGFEGLVDFVEVGRSEQAVVYRAWQPRFRRHVTVELFPGLSVEQFAAQRKAMGALAGHPNTVTVHDAGVTDDGLPFVVSEPWAGESLADLAARRGPLPLHEAAGIAIKLAAVVESARRAGTDVCIDPRRVRLTPSGDPAVTAFGARPGDGLGSLQATLALLVGIRSPVAAPVASALDLATELQEIQRHAGQPVTEIPVPVEDEQPRDPAPPDAVTIVPGKRRPAGRRPFAVSLAVVVALIGVATAVLRDSRTGGEVAGTATAERGAPVDPPLYRDAFTAEGGWKAGEEGTVIRRALEEGQYRVGVLAQDSDRQAARWRAEPPERRVSVALDAVFLSPELTRVGVACESSPGGVLGILGNDGRWAIQKYEGGPLLSGRPVSPPPEVGRPFRLELDCDAGQAFGHLTLWLDGRPLGEVEAAVPAISTVGYLVESRSAAGTEVALRKLEVRRLR